jgi:hypothetical protein
MNAIIDDGTQTLRVVFFREQAAGFLGVTMDQFKALRTDMSSYESLRIKVMGAQVKITGRVTKNQMYERLELIAASIQILD